MSLKTHILIFGQNTTELLYQYSSTLHSNRTIFSGVFIVKFWDWLRRNRNWSAWKMKILGETRRILGFLGLLHDQTGISVKSLSHKISVFICVALMPMSTLSYLLFGSMDSNEFYECAYVFVSSSTVTGCFIVLWWDERRISLFLNELESAVTKSKIFFRENVQSFLITFNLDHIFRIEFTSRSTDLRPNHFVIRKTFEKGVQIHVIWIYAISGHYQLNGYVFELFFGRYNLAINIQYIVSTVRNCFVLDFFH